MFTRGLKTNVLGLAAHTFSPTTLEAAAGGSLSLITMAKSKSGLFSESTSTNKMVKMGKEPNFPPKDMQLDTRYTHIDISHLGRHTTNP